MNLKKTLLKASIVASAFITTACSPFLFIGKSTGVEPYKDTQNSIFFALYNYYGIEGQHFTNKWLGMKDALNEHGIEVTGWEQEKDAKNFKIKRLPECDLPKDADIFMVNNQEWDPGLQFTKPIAKRKPMAIISTCNGVEFASNPIKASGIGTQNATIGGFCDSYYKAFQDGSLAYLVTKYAAHGGPIFAACVDAVDRGHAIKNEDGSALHLGVQNWAVKSLEEYDSMVQYDQIALTETSHPTIMKNNLDEFFVGGQSEATIAKNLADFTSKSTFENIKELYESNEGVKDAKRTGRKLKVGLLAPSSVNGTVQSYIDYMKNYLCDVYNCEFLPAELISSTNTQKIACETYCQLGADFVISVQDDTNRNDAIKVADENGVYFGILGTCQNPKDYEKTKMYKHFVGSVGTSIDEERRAAKEMTNYYLEKMIERGEIKK